jgi:hypothetical protein
MTTSKKQPDQKLSQSQGFTNLSQDPETQAAERRFADSVESAMNTIGIPVESQLHILAQIQADLTGQLGGDAS